MKWSNKLRFIYKIIYLCFLVTWALIGYLNIHTHITCIAHDLGALGIALKIQVMGSLQSDE